MDLGTDEWRLYWDIAQFALTGAIGVYVYFSRNGQARRDALEAMENSIEKRLDTVTDRLGMMESKLAYTPDPATCGAAHARLVTLETQVTAGVNAEDLKRVHMRVDAVAEAVADVRGTLRRIERTMDMINQFLVERPS